MIMLFRGSCAYHRMTYFILYSRNVLSLGIEELTVPPIEPLVIPKMQMENGHGAVRVRAILSNMTIHGASNYTVLNVRLD